MTHTPDTSRTGPAELAAPEVAEPDAVELEETKPSPDEVYNSLNFFDEIAIKKVFGEEILGMKKRPGSFMRALVFSILRKEKGLKDGAAHAEMANMINSEILAHFHVERPAPKCIDETCPCAEHDREEEEEGEDPTGLLS